MFDQDFTRNVTDKRGVCCVRCALRQMPVVQLSWRQGKLPTVMI